MIDWEILSELGMGTAAIVLLIVLIYQLAKMVANKFDEMDARHSAMMKEATDRYTEVIDKVANLHAAERKEWKESNERSRERLTKSLDELSVCIKKQTVIIENSHKERA